MTSQVPETFDVNVIDGSRAISLLQSVYGFLPEHGVVFAGRSLDEQLGHLNFLGDKLREMCQSYCSQEPSETGEPSPLSFSCLLDAIVATGRMACAREWLNDSVLTSVRSHDEASDLEIHVLSATFSAIFRAPHHTGRYPIASDAEIASLDRAFMTLYGRSADGGLNARFEPQREVLLSMMYALFTTRADSILLDLTGKSDLERGTQAHQTWMSTTRGTEALLRSAWDVAETGAGRMLFGLAGTKPDEAVEQAVTRAVLRKMAGTVAESGWLRSDEYIGRGVKDVDALLYAQATRRFEQSRPYE